MINRYSIGFVLVAGLTVAGVDYMEQSKKAGLALGKMSVGAYIDTVPQRFNAAKEEKLALVDEKDRKSAWRKGGVQFLPEAPEGWTRRVLMDGDDSAIMPPPDPSKSSGAGETLLQQMQGREDAKRAKARATRSYVYERGTETVFVEVKLREKPDSNSMAGLVGSVLSGSDFGNVEQAVGYNTIGGMGYVERLTYDGAREYHYRVLEGRIGFGDEVGIRVHANAGSASTNEILAAINYDGLNTLLPHPLDNVGLEFDPPAGVDGAALALDLEDLYSEFLSLRATEAQYRISNLDTNALLVNTYAQQFGGATGQVDLTGGQEMNLGTLIELAYRTAATAVRSGKSAAEVKKDVNRMVKTAVTLADAEAAAMANLGEDAPAPEMSPELAAELGLTISAPAKPTSSMTAAPDADGAKPAKMIASPGKAMMEIDTAATEAAGGNVISKSVDPQALADFQAERNTSDSEMQLAMLVVARTFEARHSLPKESCGFVPENNRLECNAAPSKLPSGLKGLIDRVSGGGADEPRGLQADEKPKRLELSNGTWSGGSRCVGSFCD